MRVSLFVVFFLTPGCGGVQVVKDIPHGFVVHPAPYTADEVDATIAQIVGLITDLHYHDFEQDLDTKQLVDVAFTYGAIACNGGEYFGCTHGSETLFAHVQVTAKYRIVGCTSLAHELLHVANEGRDLNHESDIWYARGHEDSLEGKLFDTVCNERIRAGEQLYWTE